MCPHATETIFGNKITCSFCVFALFTQDDAQLSCLGNSSRHILNSLSGDGYVKIDLKSSLVGGIPTPLKNMKVSWDDKSQYMET